MEWLPRYENQLLNAGNIAADPRSVRIQIEEMKVGFSEKLYGKFLTVSQK